MPELEAELEALIRREEAAAEGGADSLWDHLLRTAAIAEGLGRAEGLDPATCRLAALFHDAGKFHRGRRHGDDKPEEARSVEILTALASAHGVGEETIAEVSEAILQLYWDLPAPTPLAEVLFDADNLDKLGPLGVANFFVKCGLRGRGLSPGVLAQLTVELTYARHAPTVLRTSTGRARARRRAPETRTFILSLLDQLRDDGLADLVVVEVDHGGLMIDAVVPPSCACSRALEAAVSEEPGLKCTRLTLVHTCADCGERHEVRFCRPRLPEPEPAGRHDDRPPGP